MIDVYGISEDYNKRLKAMPINEHCAYMGRNSVKKTIRFQNVDAVKKNYVSFFFIKIVKILH